MKGIPLVNKDKEEKFIEVFTKTVLVKLDLFNKITEIKLGLNDIGIGNQELYLYFDSY